MAYIRRSITIPPPPTCSHILHIQFTGTASHTKAATQMLTLRLPCGLIMADAQNARNRLILAAPMATTSGRGAPAETASSNHTSISSVEIKSGRTDGGLETETISAP
ncbi:hypothetical protein DPMN_058632 [Dreissena polymorpha]|uniref:Uncharacterized protein n=1 Tax=Dreissena polymorpha TaxID=45954 RepID=A0A9D4C236_DREPO|nr:hypothetical protein DPMN_058632 [Dreissena polymorpha]